MANNQFKVFVLFGTVSSLADNTVFIGYYQLYNF